MSNFRISFIFCVLTCMIFLSWFRDEFSSFSTTRFVYLCDGGAKLNLRTILSLPFFYVEQHLIFLVFFFSSTKCTEISFLLKKRIFSRKLSNFAASWNSNFISRLIHWRRRWDYFWWTYRWTCLFPHISREWRIENRK